MVKPQKSVLWREAERVAEAACDWAHAEDPTLQQPWAALGEGPRTVWIAEAVQAIALRRAINHICPWAIS